MALPNIPSLRPEDRRPRLAAALREGRLLRAIECHNPLSALVGELARSTSGVSFDALWVSGFSHATSLGLPDAELSSLERRLESLSDIAAVTSLPLIVDADTGGDALAFGVLCRSYESLGVSAIVIEDKVGAKRSSLAPGVQHDLEDPAVFVEKIATGRAAMHTKDTLIFARIESLIAGKGLADALDRAETYLRSATDGVVIHSKDATGREVLDFMQGYRTLSREHRISRPLVLIPTAYHHIRGRDLHAAGASIIIHGNHLIRAAYSAMCQTAQSILDHDRSQEAADAYCAPVSELFRLVGTE